MNIPKVIKGTKDKPYMIWSDSWGVLATYHSFRDLESGIKYGVEIPDQKPYSFVYGHRPKDTRAYEWNEDENKIEFSHNPFSMPQGGIEALENAKTKEELLSISA